MGVKQGCILAPTENIMLDSIMFSAILTDAFQDNDNVIVIRYRFDGKSFNLRRLQDIQDADRGALGVPLRWWHV